MTNAVKAQIIAVANAVLGLLVVFHVALSMAQQGAILTVINVALAAWVAFTYKDSPKRVPDPPAQP